MNKKTAAYWAVTGLLAAGLLGSGVVKLMGPDEMLANMKHLGFPAYLLPILGSWYVAAAAALVAPGMARVKEWAYAGIIFAMSGALISHLAVGDTIAQSAPVIGFAALAIASYVLRPASRRYAA